MDECLKSIFAIGSKLNTFFSNNTSSIPSDTLHHDTKSRIHLSRFEIFPENEMFCNKPTPLYTTRYPDLFITYKEGFNIHTVKRSPLQLPEEEQYNKLTTQLNSGKIIHPR